MAPAASAYLSSLILPGVLVGMIPSTAAERYHSCVVASPRHDGPLFQTPPAAYKDSLLAPDSTCVYLGSNIQFKLTSGSCEYMHLTAPLGPSS